MLAEQAPTLEHFDGLAEGAEPFALFFEPPSLDERIVNQSAVLSATSGPTCHMEDWLGEHEGLWRVWEIPPDVKAEVRERLGQANITERVLLPGPDAPGRTSPSAPSSLASTASRPGCGATTRRSGRPPTRSAAGRRWAARSGT